VPIPQQRDSEQSRRALAAWLRKPLQADGDVELSDFRGPGATGFSNETLIVDAAWQSGGDGRTASFVVRVAPTGYTLFPDAGFETQYRVLRTLSERTSVPVPKVRWYEADAAVLGAPFFVMDEIRGMVPEDNPPYHMSGWLHDVSPEHRARVWWGAIDTLAELHTLDWRGVGLDFLARSERGAPGLSQQLAYYEDFLHRVERDEAVPVARRALTWLRENRPEDDPLVVVWGDARIGNVMYDEAGNRLAVLDWEMATLGSPSQDVAWAMFLDRHHSEGCDVPRLPGFPSREETVARYEQRSALSLHSLDYYEVFAGFLFSTIMGRLAVIFKDWGLLPPDDGMAQENTATRLTEKVLAERGA
jgi:aminoglycoside phosphotransferase (APT) family kinase protein